MQMIVNNRVLHRLQQLPLSSTRLARLTLRIISFKDAKAWSKKKKYFGKNVMHPSSSNPHSHPPSPTSFVFIL